MSSSLFLALPDSLKSAVDAGNATSRFDAAANTFTVTLSNGDVWRSPVAPTTPSDLPAGFTLRRGDAPVSVPTLKATEFTLQPAPEPPKKAAPRSEAAGAAAPSPSAGPASSVSDDEAAAGRVLEEYLTGPGAPAAAPEVVMSHLAVKFSRAAVLGAIRARCVRTKEGLVTLRSTAEAAAAATASAASGSAAPRRAPQKPKRTWGGKEVDDDFDEAAIAAAAASDDGDEEDEAAKKERMEAEAEAAEQRRAREAAASAAAARRAEAEAAAAKLPPVNTLKDVPMPDGFSVAEFPAKVAAAVAACDAAMKAWRADSELENPSALGPRVATRGLLTVAHFRATTKAFEAAQVAADAGAALVRDFDHAAAEAKQWLETSQATRSPADVRDALSRFFSEQRAALAAGPLVSFATCAKAAQQAHSRLSAFRDMVTAGVINVS